MLLALYNAVTRPSTRGLRAFSGSRGRPGLLALGRQPVPVQIQAQAPVYPGQNPPVGRLVYSVALADSWAPPTEAIAVGYKGIVGLPETVGLSESLGVVYLAILQTVTLSETVNLSEVLSVVAKFFPAPAETWSTWSESLSTVYRGRPSISETVGLAESVLARAAFRPPLAETVALAESLLASYRTSVGLGETWPLWHESVFANIVHTYLETVFDMAADADASPFGPLRTAEAPADQVTITDLCYQTPNNYVVKVGDSATGQDGVN